jgi:hypothetical protein
MIRSGKKTSLSLWFTPGDDVFGYFARSRRLSSASVWQLMDSDADCLSFSFQADAEGAPGRRGLGMAPGLWVLV